MKFSTGHFVIYLVAAIFLCAATVICLGSSYTEIHGVNRIDSEPMLLQTKLEEYRLDFGKYPEMNNSEIYRTLSGENQKHKVYLAFPRPMINSENLIIDPWKTPYTFTMVDGYPFILSAGPNRRFGDGDDRPVTE